MLVLAPKSLFFRDRNNKVELLIRNPVIVGSFENERVYKVIIECQNEFPLAASRGGALLL